MKAFTIVPMLATAVVAKEALGCYPTLDLGDTANTSTNESNTWKSCRGVCSVSAHKYTAVRGTECICVDQLPASAPVNDEQCDTPCPGGVFQVCGGEDKAYTVLDTKPELYHPANDPAIISNYWTPLGCYSSLPLTEGANQSINDFNSWGQCLNACRVSSHKYTALQGSKCTCVDELPPAGALVADEQCDAPCPGYEPDSCGGKDGKAWTVLDTEPDANEPSSYPTGATLSGLPTLTVTPYPIPSATRPAVTGTNSTATHASSITTATDLPTSTPLPAAAVAGNAYLGSVAAAMGLGVVANFF